MNDINEIVISDAAKKLWYTLEDINLSCHPYQGTMEAYDEVTLYAQNKLKDIKRDSGPYGGEDFILHRLEIMGSHVRTVLSMVHPTTVREWYSVWCVLKSYLQGIYLCYSDRP